MYDFVDIHSHILPGIDDGSKDFSMSIQMLKIASDNGITGIILTPHNKPGRHNAGSEKIAFLIRKLREELEKEKISIELYPGNELYYRTDLSEEVLEGRACTMAGSRYVLAEFNPMDSYEYIRSGIYSLMAGGFSPILAHVERYSNINGKTERVEDLIEMGCYIQVNAGSIMGSFGLGTKMFTRKLLREQLVHFVATDAHDTEKRSPKIMECASFISRKYGEKYMQELFCENPMHVIKDEYI